MQSMLNLRAIHGVPICLSGITNPLSLSKEIQDHDRRRKDMRKQRSLAREGVHANQEFIGTQTNFVVEIKGGDLDDILNDLSLDFTAKAA
ncbi:unnamed protein product [Lupinus luteus]|uniref:Uncharacterized protein n=1 Tax=Lupinus luteus TaxID=3873 RepID=A0AAV1W4Q1_LUPLU